VEVAVKIALRTAGAVALAVLALSGCRTLFGRGHGPIDSFAFLPEHNPGLTRPVTGMINELSEPKTIEMVVPPGTDASHLVATISLNTTATIQVISSGSPVTQTNSRTPNDFQSPVLYSVTTSKDKEPWQYRVLVRPADTNAKLAQLSVADGSTLQPQFDPSGTSFSTTVPYAAAQVRIDARAQSPHLQQMTIGGQNVRGAAGTVTLPFSGIDQLDVPITATAEDQTTEAHYTLTVLRGQPDRNSSLNSLRIEHRQLHGPGSL
jgi:Cadherin-like beta sandwich domain